MKWVFLVPNLIWKFRQIEFQLKCFGIKVFHLFIIEASMKKKPVLKETIFGILMKTVRFDEC